MDFVDDPEDTVNFHPVLNSKLTQPAITGQKNAAWIAFRQRKREAVMNGQARKYPHNLLRA